MASTGGYQPIGPEAPLLNPPAAPRSKWRTTNLVLGVLTTLLMIFTFISSFIFHSYASVALNVFFSVCILFACITNLSSILWYRKQEAASMIEYIIYVNSFNIILLCICANLYHHGY